MTPAEWIGGAVALGTLIALLGSGLRSLLRAFHAEHIAPSIIGVSHAIADNTKATSALTEALAKTNESQVRGFERLGDIIADHETRISVLEQPPRPPMAIRKRKAS